MNIIFISRLPYPNGMAGTKRIRLFAEYLANNETTVNIFILANSNGLNNFSGIHNKVKYQLIKFNYIHLFLGNKYLNQQLVNLYDKQKNNIIYLYGGLSIITAKLLSFASTLGYKIVADIVEDYSVHKERVSFHLKLKYKLDTIINNKMISNITGVIVISNYLKNKFESLKIDRNKIQLIPISAENIFHKPIKIQNRDIFRFVYSGTFGVKDGIDFMLNAYKKLFKKYPNIELTLVGKTGRIGKNYKYLKNLNSNYNIKYLGLIPEEKYYDFLQDSDVLMMTRIGSKYANSGFPFKLGEYLATGNPVIATDVSDIKLYLRDKIDIILASPSDSESLFKAMEYTVLNYQKCVGIGLNGKNAASKYFNPIINGKLLQDFLDRI